MDVGATNPHILKLEIAHPRERFIITLHFVRLGGCLGKGLQCTPDCFQDVNSRMTSFVDPKENTLFTILPLRCSECVAKIYVITA